MEGAKMSFVMAIFVVLMSLILPTINAQAPVPAPGPSPSPTSDGATIDQGVAYVLMMLALALTYIMH
ncbi:arabinogalactan protein 22 [Artemisia annua]|uniref:Arabinogalactan protein 22 n=1 Tax=Artemisia annua TaxID=35608 RepID=A0A2U1MUE8_ARTAN|nr:arabinogalactan protein 22 [Artemisia annua]